MPDRSDRIPAAVLLLLSTAIPMLSGCADGRSYPSLAIRPVERLTDTPPVTAATPGPSSAIPVAPAADLVARLDQLVAQARSAKRDFDDKQAAAARQIAAAGGAAPGSEGWAQATQALSGLESARSLTAQPLTDIDRLDVEDQLHGAGLAPDPSAAPRPDTAAIAQARATIAALVAEEDAALAKLDGRLAG